MDGISTVNGSTQGSLFGDGYVTILLQGYDTEQVLQVLLNQYGYDVSELKYCSGVMGVPITFLDKFCPEQFEIVGADFQLAEKIALANGKMGTGRFYVTREKGRERLYSRLVIRRMK